MILSSQLHTDTHIGTLQKRENDYNHNSTSVMSIRQERQEQKQHNADHSTAVLSSGGSSLHMRAVVPGYGYYSQSDGDGDGDGDSDGDGDGDGDELRL